MPVGFKIEVFAEGVSNARAMCWGDRGTLFVGSRDLGMVHALEDTDGDGHPDVQHIIAKGLQMPAGVEFRNGDRYVSSGERIVKFR